MTPEANSRPGDRRKRPRGMNITSNTIAAAAALRGRAKLADQGMRLATTSQAHRTADRYTPVRMPMRNVALRSQENHREPGGWKLGMGSALIPRIRPSLRLGKGDFNRYRATQRTFVAGPVHSTDSVGITPARQDRHITKGRSKQKFSGQPFARCVWVVTFVDR